MRKKLIMMFTILLFTHIINAQGVSDVVSSSNPTGSITIDDQGGFIHIIGNPVSENDDCLVGIELSNKGLNGKQHAWQTMTSSYAGNWGVASNGYELWEYPASVSQDECCKRRFVIQTSRDYANYSPFVIGARGGVSIGYLPYGFPADINDLSVNGNVGIGTWDTQGYKLAVNGTIRAKEIKVESGWADFVFGKDYKLPSLKEVEEHINEKGTLPGVPSEADVKANGVNLGETNALLLQKIEELTLYVIKQQKEIDELKSQINNR